MSGEPSDCRRHVVRMRRTRPSASVMAARLRHDGKLGDASALDDLDLFTIDRFHVAGLDGDGERKPIASAIANAATKREAVSVFDGAEGAGDAVVIFPNFQAAIACRAVERV